MKYPNFSEEKKLYRKGYKYIVGLDEVGRGPLAGPVVACAVIFTTANFKIQKALFISPGRNKNLKWKMTVQNLKLLDEIKDSKKLTPKKREEFYKVLANHPQIKWGIGSVSEGVIDKINILEATKLAMKRAINNIKNTSISAGILGEVRPNQELKIKPDFLILDGNFKIDINIPQRSIVRADEKVFSCAVASILAKVTRDRLMEKYDKEYPQYGFKKNKGYPTEFHLEMLRKHSHCRIHRKTFGPIRQMKSSK